MRIKFRRTARHRLTKITIITTAFVITVDCRDIEPIKQELLVYVADNVAAMPAIKLHEFVLSPIDDNEHISPTEVVTAIREFLESIREEKNFAVITHGDMIVVRSINGKAIQRKEQTSGNIEGMFACTHCGFVTQYEVEYHNHVRIHYL